MGISDRELFAYTAGIFDGDGCFSISRNAKGTYAPLAQVQMTDKSVPMFLQEAFGGHFSTIEAKGNCEQLHLWALAAKPAIAGFIPNILPYLRTKQLPALILREFCVKFNCGKGAKYTPEQLQEMEVYRQMIFIANGKGPGSIEKKVVLYNALTGTHNA